MALWGCAGPTITWVSCRVWKLVVLVTWWTRWCLAQELPSVPLLPCRQQAKVIETLPGDHSSISVFDATLVQSDPLPVFLVDGSIRCRAGGIYHPDSNFALAWGLEQLVVRQLEWSLSVRPTGRFRWWRPTVRCILRCPAFTEMSHLKRRSNVLYKAHPKPAVKMCGVSSRPFSSGGYQRGADDQSSNTLPAALRAGYMLRAIALVLGCTGCSY